MITEKKENCVLCDNIAPGISECCLITALPACEGNCSGCGWDKDEYARRQNESLEELPNGLRGYVTRAKEGETK